MDTITQTPYSTNFEKLSDLKNYLGKELGLTDWMTITQEGINTFASLTDDEQWIHTDVEKSKQFSPYKTTVAHGFMVLSMASKFAYETITFGNVVMGVNYGMNKVRFPNPTRVNSKLRGRVSLMDYKEIPNGAQYVMKIEFELEGEPKPACVAEFVARAYV